MIRLMGCVALIAVIACGDDDGGGASCSDACDVASDCGLAIPDCVATCNATTTPAQRACVVNAADCLTANACFEGDFDGGTGDGGGSDDGGSSDGGPVDSSCRPCMGSINGDAYDVLCGESFCADGLVRACVDGEVAETSLTCGGSCIEQGASGCGDEMNCCDVAGGTPVCMDGSCCQLDGPATSASTCCFIFLEEEDASCCVATASDSCS